MNSYKIILLIFLIHSGNAFGLSYYDILDVNPSSSQEEIKKAYRRLAMKYHPDRNLSGNTNERMKQINVAYETLKNQSTRSAYDRQYRGNQSTYGTSSEWNAGYQSTYGTSSEWNAGYQFNYEPNFFYQYEENDSFEERKIKQVWNALKVLSWHSYVPFEDLRTSWDVIQDTHKKMKWKYKTNNSIIFNDINKSYKILYEFFYKSYGNEVKEKHWNEKKWNQKGFWIIVIVLLLFKAKESKGMETMQTEFIEKPSVVEYTEHQGVPLKGINCSAVFTRQ